MQNTKQQTKRAYDVIKTDSDGYVYDHLGNKYATKTELAKAKQVMLRNKN